MKCENCPAMQNTSYEYQEWECVLGIDEEEFKDGSCGCRNKKKTIEKWLDEMIDARADEWSGFADFIEQEEKKNEAIAKAIKEVLFSSKWCICMKYQDGTLSECNTDMILKNYSWEIRSKFEELLEENVEDINNK